MEELVLVVGEADFLLLAGAHPHPAGGPRAEAVAGEQDGHHQDRQQQERQAGKGHHGERSAFHRSLIAFDSQTFQ